MIEQYLWIAGSLPFIVLGSIHLAYTFFTNKFSCRDSEVEGAMKKAHPVITRRITMWKAWIGFNASHSSGIIYIGLINFLLALLNFDIVRSGWFLALNMATTLFYLWVGKTYWFGVPFKGIVISTCFFAAATVIIILK